MRKCIKVSVCCGETRHLFDTQLRENHALVFTLIRPRNMLEPFACTSILGLEGDNVYALVTKVYDDKKNLNLKKKFEANLIKEFKKLQKFRDQIMTWQKSPEIKKGCASRVIDLENSRNRIEIELGRFKHHEKKPDTAARVRDLKMKAPMDPTEIAKSETREWVNNTVLELESQIGCFQEEMDGLFVKKGKTRQPRLTHLESSINRHQAHIMKLQSILRSIDNDELSPNQVNDVKDFVEDYVQRNQDDFDEFEDVDTLYNTLFSDEGVADAQETVCEIVDAELHVVLIDDMIRKILTSLPLSKVCKCLVLSKFWNVELRAWLDSMNEKTHFLLPVSGAHHSIELTPPYVMSLNRSPIQSSHTRIIGSVNDLLLVVCKNLCERSYFLLNPCTGATSLVPSNGPIPGLSVLERLEDCYSYGFGCGEGMTDLIVVVILKSSRDNSRITDMFHTSENRWNRLVEQGTHTDIATDAALFLENTRSLYWLGTSRQEGSTRLVCFHLDSSEFLEVGLNLGPAVPVGYMLGSLFGQLSMLLKHPDGSDTYNTMSLDGRFEDTFRPSLHKRFPNGYKLMSISNGRFLIYTEDTSFRRNRYEHHIFTIYNIMDESYGVVENVETLGHVSSFLAAPYVSDT